MSQEFHVSGDAVAAPDGSGTTLDVADVLRRVAVGFRRVVIDWDEGDRWVDARVAAATEIGYRGFLLEAEQALRGQSVLVSAADRPGACATWVRFYLTRDTGLLELRYDPADAWPAGRELGVKLATLLGYEFVPAEVA